MNNRIKGSLTVECTLVMPVILSALVLLVSFLIFLYNRNILLDAATLGVKNAAYFEDCSNREIEEAVALRSWEAARGRLIYLENLHMDVSVGKAQVKVSFRAELKTGPFIVTDLPMPFHELEVEVKADRFRPSQVIRNIRKGEELIEWIKERGKGDDGGVQKGYEMQLSDSSQGNDILSITDVHE